MESFSGILEEDEFVRADEIDLKDLDKRVDKEKLKLLTRLQMSKPQGSMEEWEIDLAKLEVDKVVATGEHGTVFRGSYDGLDVAVKLLDWGADGYRTKQEIDSLRGSFEREVAVWHKLDHPNVAKFVGASMGTIDLKVPEDNDARTDLPPRACVVVVEFFSGGPLKGHLRDNTRRKLPYKEVVKIALDLARGLNYLHSQKIVHRDVKLENLMFDAHGNIKIIDFGVARVEAQVAIDMTGVTGTLAYMAPEVLEQKEYDHNCDVYSFGICLWEIYCCDLVPYIDLSYTEMNHAVVHENMRPEIPMCCPSKLAKIMQRCWHPDPSQRPDMDEVVKLLEALDTRKGGMTRDGELGGGCTCFGRPRRP